MTGYLAPQSLGVLPRDARLDHQPASLRRRVAAADLLSHLLKRRYADQSPVVLCRVRHWNLDHLTASSIASADRERWIQHALDVLECAFPPRWGHASRVARDLPRNELRVGKHEQLAKEAGVVGFAERLPHSNCGRL
jgi:hypothetical protein